MLPLFMYFDSVQSICIFKTLINFYTSPIILSRKKKKLSEEDFCESHCKNSAGMKCLY